MINLPPVCGLIPTTDESSEGGVICELQELDGLVAEGAAVCVQGNDQRGNNKPVSLRHVFPASHADSCLSGNL